MQKNADGCFMYVECTQILQGFGYYLGRLAFCFAMPGSGSSILFVS